MKKNNKLILIAIIILIGLWQVISINIDNELIFPSSVSVLKKMYIISTESTFISSVGFSIYRCLISAVISILIAVILSFGSYLNKYIYNFCYPILSITRSLPTMAFIVLALIWISKDYAPMLIGILISFPIFYDVILNALVKVDDDLLEMCTIYKVNKKRIFIDIYIRSVMFSLIEVLSSSISLIFKVVIAGELYAQPKYGIGAAIQFEKMQLNTDSIIAWILIVALISIVFDKVIHMGTKNMFLWKRSSNDAI